MFIELTDHLRCPEEHPEQFLVLLPGRMEGREVRTGDLGCPVCGRTWQLDEGVLDFRTDVHAAPGSDPPAPPLPVTLNAEAALAFLGLGGPGGFILVAGTATVLLPDLAALLPGVGWVSLNPPPARTAAHSPWPAGTPPPSVIHAPRFPLKSSCLRGVVLGAPAGSDPDWIREAARSVLPGLRVVGVGSVAGPEGVRTAGLTLLGHTEGCWVAWREP